MLLEGREALKIPENARNIAIFAGPEGGFTDGEVKAAETAGIKTVSAGEHTLRSETAMIAALAIAGRINCRKKPRGKPTGEPQRGSDSPQAAE
jgi:RsmE family RNA methyltransferase